MDDARFDSVIRHLGENITRRGAIGALAGLSALALSDVAGKKRKRRNKKARRVSAEITDGQPDNEKHPYVGLMSAQDAAGNHLWRCSGTLLSPTLFLTAGHCTERPAEHVEIWFDEDLRTDPSYPKTGDVGGTPYTHPQYDPNAFYLFDLGVVVLDEAYTATGGQFGVLPALNQLDGLAKKRGSKKGQIFTAVGYGLQQAFPDATSWKEQADRIRMVATPRLLQINNGYTGDYSIVLTNNPQTGGTCFGDSGGPNFIGDSNVIGGVTSFGKNWTCAGTGGVYRVDRADDLNWLCEDFDFGCP